MGLRFARFPSGAAAAVLVLASCNGGTVLDPETEAGFGSAPELAAVPVLEEVCATVDFESLVHGDEIASVSVPELELAFNVTVWPTNSGLPIARAYSTDTMSPPGDPFLAWAGSASSCPECLGRGNVLVLEDGAGFASGGASDFGGTFFLDGFTQPDVELHEVTAIATSFEASHQLRIDAEQVASSVASDGSVQRLIPDSSLTIASFVELVILSSARGGFDDLRICRLMEVTDAPPTVDPGGEGCPVSFWKIEGQTEAWQGTGIGPDTRMGDHLASLPAELARPEQDQAPAGLSFEQSLRLRGSGVNRLLREAAASYLNAASSAVNFDLTTEEVEAVVRSVVEGGDLKTATKTLAGFNHQACPFD
jgi:hypothetical protein